MDEDTRLAFLNAMLRLQVFGNQEIEASVKGLSRSQIKKELEAMVEDGLLKRQEEALSYPLYVISNSKVAMAWGKELLSKRPIPTLEGLEA